MASASWGSTWKPAAKDVTVLLAFSLDSSRHQHAAMCRSVLPFGHSHTGQSNLSVPGKMEERKPTIKVTASWASPRLTGGAAAASAPSTASVRAREEEWDASLGLVTAKETAGTFWSRNIGLNICRGCNSFQSRGGLRPDDQLTNDMTINTPISLSRAYLEPPVRLRLPAAAGSGPRAPRGSAAQAGTWTATAPVPAAAARGSVWAGSSAP